MNDDFKRSFFEENILIHYDSLYFFVKKTLRNREASEDAVQSTIEKAWKNFDQLRDLSKAKSWVFSIARNEMLVTINKNKRMISCEWLEEVLSENEDSLVESDALSVIIRREEKKYILEAMDDLSESRRELLTLRYCWNYSEKKIAEMKGMKYSTVRVYIHRALKDLLYHYKSKFR